MKITVNNEKCTGCGICINVCPQKILELHNEKSVCVEPKRCIGCFGCEDECTFYAIKITRAPRNVENIEIEPPLNIPECDVVVVGAGPSGLGAAITCAKEGLNVIVLERLPNRKMSHHPDGGLLVAIPGITSIKIINSKIVFPELQISIKSNSARKCESLGLIGPSGLSTKSKVKKNFVIYTSHKDKFVENLADSAGRSGAGLWYNAKVIDVLKDNGKISGVELDSGFKIKAKVVITADGVFGKISQKGGMKLSNENLWYANILAFEWKNTTGLPAQLYYLNGDFNFDEKVPVIFGGIAVSNIIHVMGVVLSRKKFYPSDYPMDYFVSKILKDKRVTDLLGKEFIKKRPETLSGCRAVFREKPNRDTVSDGIISVGDAWVDDGEISNAAALSNGVYAGRVIIEAFKKNDFSKAALSPANNFITDKIIGILSKNKQMKLLETELSKQELIELYRMMRYIDYPVLMIGNPVQQGMMFINFILRNLFNIIKNYRIFKKII